MTWRGDLPDDRGVPAIDEATAESLLAGGEVRSDLEPVATFLRALRATARRRVTPGPRLAAEMAGGRYAGPDPHRHRSGGRHAAAQPAGMTTARLAAWASAAGLVAAMVGTATAGFARALPEPAQQRFESVVKSVTGYDFPDGPADSGAPTGRWDVDDGADHHAAASGATPPDRAQPGRPEGRGPDGDRPFGAWVRDLDPDPDGPGHGEAVSARAREWAGASGPGRPADGRGPGGAGPGGVGPNGAGSDGTGPAGAEPAGPPVPTSMMDGGGPGAPPGAGRRAGGGPPGGGAPPHAGPPDTGAAPGGPAPSSGPGGDRG